MRFSPLRRLLVFILFAPLFSALLPAQTFVHPGILHSQADLDRLKTAVASQTNPIYQGYQAFAAHSLSKATYSMQGPFAVFGRNAGENTTPMHNDANAAYQNAVMWAVTGDQAHAAKAIQILNSWSSTMTAVVGTEPALCSLDGYKLVNAAEILRYTPSGWAPADIARAEQWFKGVWYPSFSDFALHANGNWDAAATKTMMAIGVFCDDRAPFERAVRYYLDGAGNGRLTHYVVNADGQVQESGRDQPHTMLGLGLLAEAAQIGWNQGLDLFSVASHRLLQGFEYTANYNLGNTVPFTPMLDRTGKYGAGGTTENYSVISTIGRGGYRPVFELAWNHYYYRAGLPATAVAFSRQFAEANRPEGAATSADHPGFGTFLFSFAGPLTPTPASAPPLAPAGLFAEGGPSNITVTWAPSRDVTGYSLKRSSTSAGPYITLASALTSPTYTDNAVAPGQLYYYIVSATNARGEGPDSLPVSIAAGLPAPWINTDIGAVGNAGRADFDATVFKLEGGGSDIGGTSDQFHFAYAPMAGDGAVLARITLPLSSQRAKVGLMIRETLAANSAHASLLLPVVSNATWITRNAAGAATVTGASAPIPAPYVTNNHLDSAYWAKLTRQGNVFSGAISPDGVTWTSLGSSTLPMAGKVYVGLAACSRIPGVTTTASFDHVALSAFPPAGPGVPAIMSPSAASTASGGAFTYAIEASNAPSSFSATSLPPGLILNATTGVISGTPLATGSFVVTLTATNASGSSSAPLTITVSPSIGLKLRAYNSYGLAASDVAGILRTSFWNNLVGPATTGETVSIKSLTNHLGLALPGITATWNAGKTGGNYTSSGTLKLAAEATDDANLFASAFDQFDTTPSTLSVTGIPYRSYDFIVYVYDGGATQGGTITVNGLTRAIRGGAGNPDATGNGYVLADDAVHSSDTDVAQGNYVRFSSLSGNLQASFVATNVGSTIQHLKIAGIQIIGRDSTAAPAVPPATPSDVTASGGNTQVALNWSASDTATSYKIYRNGTPLATIASPLLSYPDLAVTNGASYSYQVSAVNSVGEGARTPGIDATPAAPAYTPTPVSIYHYSVAVAPIYASRSGAKYPTDPDRRAYLWVPPAATKIQGVLVGLHNMSEKPLFDDPVIRQACTVAQLGIVFISGGDARYPLTPNGSGGYTTGPANMALNLDPNSYVSQDIDPATGKGFPADLNPVTGARFTNQSEQAGAELAQVLVNLAKESGYQEIAYSPLLLVGHSAASPFVWTRTVATSAALSGRVFALLAYKGFNPDSIPPGIPVLHVSSEWQEITNWGSRWELSDAASMRQLRSAGADRLLGELVQPGSGHYDYSENQSAPLAGFIKAAAAARLPANWPTGAYPVLTKIDPTHGYLVDVTKISSGNVQPTAYAAWIAAGKDPLRAYWYPDLTTAQAVCDTQNAGFAKRGQLISAFQNAGTLNPVSGSEGFVNLNPILEGDGVTFRVRAASLSQSPVPRQFNGAPLGIASGSVRFKANGSGALRQTGPDTFRVWMDRGGNPYRLGQPWEPFVIARQPGDAVYRQADRPIHLATAVPVFNISGAPQTITFPAIPDQNAGALQPITLNATSSSSLPVQYWVVSGPYHTDPLNNNILVPDVLPAKGRYPMRVVVGAWQWGRPNTTRSAAPVLREFLIQSSTPVITSPAKAQGTYGAPFLYQITASGSPTLFRALGLPAGLTLDASTGTIAGTPSLPGNYVVTVSAVNSLGSNTLSVGFIIAKAAAAVTLTALHQTYDGASKSVSATTQPSGLTVTLLYNGSTAAPVNAGSYAVTATIADPLYTGSAAGTLVIVQTRATLTLGNLTQTFDGKPKPVSAATVPAGLSLAYTYDGSATAPTNVGSYAVTATIVDSSYTGSASSTLTIQRAPATITLSNLTQTYSGTALSVTATTRPAGLTVDLTYNGSTTRPVHPGHYAIGARVNHPNYQGVGTGTLTIEKKIAALALSGLLQSYDGSTKTATALPTPRNLTVRLSYDGALTAPVYPGSYAIAATIDDPDYAASAADTLVLTTTAVVRHAPDLNGALDGSAQVLLPENVTLNAGASVSGDLLLPGRPAIQRLGSPTYGSTVDGLGAMTPTNYQVLLRGGSLLRHTVRRIDALALTAVLAPPLPSGTRNVWISPTATTAGNYANIRNLTLNGPVGLFVVPAGNFGAFTAHSGSGFAFGTVGATEPALYSFQNLILTGTSQLRVDGPVVVTLANGAIFTGTLGNPAHPEWLTLRVASGGITCNHGATLHGTVIAPNGTVAFNDSTLTGRVISDRLTINGTGALIESH